MANEELKVVLSLDGASALGAAAKQADMLDTALTETMTDGQKMAAGLNRAADLLQSELKGAEAAAAALARELGTDGVATMQKMGTSVEQLVQQLHDAGLAYTSIEADAGVLAQSSSRLAAVGSTIKSNVADPAAQASASFGQAGGAVRAFASQAVQELGSLRDVVGPMSSSLGQLAGWATTGGIGFGDLVKFAVPMAGLGVLVSEFTATLAENAKQQKFLSDQTAAFAATLDQARKANEEATSSIVAGWEKAGKIDAQISNATATIVEFGQATDDMGKIHDLAYPTAQKHVVDFAVEIDKLGLRAEDFARLSMSSVDVVQAWGKAMVDSGADAKQVNLVMQGAVALHARLDDAQKASAVSARIFGDDIAYAARNTDRMGEAARNSLAAANALKDTMNHALSSSYLGESARAGLSDNMWQKYTASLKKGGGGAVAATKSTVDDIAQQWRDIVDNQAELGDITQDQYRAALVKRLNEFEKYSAGYMDTVRKINAIDKASADAKQAEADAVAKAAKDAADAAKQAEKDALEMAAHRAIVAADIGGATYATINTAADPRAVVNAIREFVQYNGPIAGITP